MTHRIVIAGVPRAGKTTLALATSSLNAAPVRHTDDLLTTHGWSDASATVAEWFDRAGPWVIEGVASARALRKWLLGHDGGRLPVDVVLHMSQPRAPLTDGQARMAKGCLTVWEQVRPVIVARGVCVIEL